jgi:hypothetical protein
MGILLGPVEAIGEAIGKILGNALVQAVIAYFTAGAGASIGIVKEITEAMGAVGKAVGEAIKLVKDLLGKLLGWIKDLAAKFAGWVKGKVKGILAKMGKWLKGVAEWLGKLFGKVKDWIKKRFELTPAEKAEWVAYEGAVKALCDGHERTGITRADLKKRFSAINRSHRTVAKWPSFITKHGPHWRLWVRKKKTFWPRIVGRATLDAETRLKQALKAARSAVKALYRGPSPVGLDQIRAILPPIATEYQLARLDATYEEAEKDFKVEGVVNPKKKFKVFPKRPTDNKYENESAHRSVTVDPLVKVHGYNSPQSWPEWEKLAKIKVPAGGWALYVRGHLAHGKFGSGDPKNLAPITRSANAQMYVGVEGQVIGLLKRRKGKPVLRYEVTTGSPNPAKLPVRSIEGKCRKVDEEARMVRSVTVRVLEYQFQPATGAWRNPKPLISTGAIKNVPSYPAGYNEPCKPAKVPPKKKKKK